LQQKSFGKAKKIHFVGIGGIGMSGIAELLLNLGYEVSGSDIKKSKVIERLVGMGGNITIGHEREHVGDSDVVVYSSAVSLENPEVLEAKERTIPVIPRAEMLAELMRLKYGVAIAGAHGKTTTTSMIASILMAGSLDPTVIIGGRLDIWGGGNAKLGQGDILVAESDESDGSFTVLSPTIAVVTNIDREHLDHYGDIDGIRDAFTDFINKIPFYGLAILCLDNEEIQTIIPRLKKRHQTYGMNSQADLRAREITKDGLETSFEVVEQDQSLGRILVGMPGTHNALNALAAIAVARELDVPMECIHKGLRDLGGVERRFQVKGELQNVLVLDDYGHHPTEILATLETVRDCWPDRRVIVVFQPHRYSRTRSLFDRFVLSFNDADVLLVAPVYGAGEQPMDGANAEDLCKGIREHGHKEVFFGKDQKDILKSLSDMAQAGDIILTLGAGDIYRVGEAFLRRG
jgi:UDP-N-acetylmuramate--alanine ligase